MRRPKPASVAVFSLLVLPFAIVSISAAQMNSAQASSAQSGASSAGHASFSGSSGASYSSRESGQATFSQGGTPSSAVQNPGKPHDPHSGHSSSEVYAVPYAYGFSPEIQNPEAADANPDDSDADYQGGPTIFDRRGSGAASYVPPVNVPAVPRQNADAAASTVPPKPTVIVFKDGQTLEVGNYAIVGANLVEINPGATRNIALAEIDIPATRRANGDRGASLPLGPAPSEK